MIFKPEMVVAIQAGAKSVTRRAAGTRIAVGDRRAVQLGMGRTSIGEIEIVDVREERLGELTDAEARLEGVADRTAFIALWMSIHGSWVPEQLVTRIEFREVARFQRVCSCCAGSGAVA